MRARAVIVLALMSVAACHGGATGPTSTSTNSSGVESPPIPLSALITIQESSTVEAVGTGQTGTSNNYLGQSITIPAGASFNNLRFNWDDNTSTAPTAPPSRGPLAAGDLFLLTQEYVGLPGGLGSTTPGFLARAERIEGGQYVFAPSVTLNGGTKYWFYSYWTPGTARGFSPITGFSEDGYLGGDMYIAPELGGTFNPLPFRKAQASQRVISFGPPIVYYTPPPGTFIDANFKLIGAPARQ